MLPVVFCQDGLFVRVSNEEGDGVLNLSIVDTDASLSATFSGHIDELLAVAHGLSFQAGNADGHLMIALAGDDVRLSFGLTQDGGRTCTVPRSEFEGRLMSLKTLSNR